MLVERPNIQINRFIMAQYASLGLIGVVASSSCIRSLFDTTEKTIPGVDFDMQLRVFQLPS
jgi:hypothetical protein